MARVERDRRPGSGSLGELATKCINKCTCPYIAIFINLLNCCAVKGISMGTSSSTVASIPRIHFSTICLLLANLLVYQIAFLHGHASISARNTQHGDFNPIAFEHRPRISPLVLNHSHAIPIGHAIALPSIRVDNATDRAGGYGGEGDKPHLGGFVEVDMHGISPGTWTFLLETIGVKSIIDVGCGRGISTSWFLMHGVDALCVEGSHDAREKTMLPDPENQMVEHDFARGPWWPDKTYDAVWCVEFLEHVSSRICHQTSKLLELRF